MKKLATILVASALLALVASAAMASNAVRISQVWSGGGSASSTSTYKNDYVEIFNSSGTAVDISNWTLEYGSATGNWGSSTANIFTFPAGTSIQACKYILVQMSGSTGGANLPVTPDFNGGLSMGAASGKVALFNAVNTNLACSSEIAGTLVDKVAWGAANCAETAAITSGTLSTNLGAGRNGDGMNDSDNNNADFTVALLTPRNSASAANAACLATPTTRSTWGQLKSIYR